MKHQHIVLGLLLIAALSGCEYLEKTVPGLRSEVVAPVTNERQQTEPPTAPRPEQGQAAPKPEPAAKKPQIIRGTGKFVNPDVGTRRSVVASESGSITLNFADADLREVIRTMLSEVLDANYSIDPQVQGKVTLQTSRPVSRDSVLTVLENVLALNGAAIIDDGGFYKIVTTSTARQFGLPSTLGPAGRTGGVGYQVKIVPLAHISAAEMREIIHPFISSTGLVRADRARNLLIMTGTSQELSALTDMVETFDVDWLSGMSFGLYPLDSVDAKTLVREMETVFDNVAAGPLAGRLQFFPIERMNAVLVIAQRADHLAQADDWIKRLDQGGDGVGKRLYVYYVENRRADELAPILSEIFSTEKKATDSIGAAEVAPGLTRDTVEVSPPDAPSAEQVSARAAPSDADAASAPAAKSAHPIAGVFGVGEGVGLAAQGDIRIIADTKKNALVILAAPSDYRIIESALRKLDVVPLQVLIEATIAEVTLNDTLKYGVEWFFQNGNSSITLSDLSTGAIQASFPGFSYFFNTANTKVAIDLLDSVSDVKVISSPQLMVLDNETASLLVGDQVPVATQSAVTVTDPNAPIVNSIQHLDTGVILEVTPRVNANGLVILDILQEVSDAVSTSSSGIDSPTIQKRRISSSVAIQNGETIALGGMIKDSNTAIESGMPVLKDIPLLGHLFKQNSDTTVRTELLILLTPRVVRGRADTRRVTDELRQRLRSLAPLEEKVK